MTSCRTGLPTNESNATTHVHRVDRTCALRDNGNALSSGLRQSPRFINNAQSAKSPTIKDAMRTRPGWNIRSVAQDVADAIAKGRIGTVAQTTTRLPEADPLEANAERACAREHLLRCPQLAEQKGRLLVRERGNLAHQIATTRKRQHQRQLSCAGRHPQHSSDDNCSLGVLLGFSDPCRVQPPCVSPPLLSVMNGGPLLTGVRPMHPPQHRDQNATALVIVVRVGGVICLGDI